MELTTIMVLVVLAALIVYGARLYNGLIQVKNNVKMSWSNIDVLLKQRHDELPKLVDTCKEYMKYEQSTLMKIMEARGEVMVAREKNDMHALGKAEGKLRMGLANLFALAEDYPELKASQTFVNLQIRISQLENSVADRREMYNEFVNQNNIRIAQFPDILFARLFGFNAFDLLAFSDDEKQDINIKALFNT